MKVIKRTTIRLILILTRIARATGDMKSGGWDGGTLKQRTKTKATTTQQIHLKTPEISTVDSQTAKDLWATWSKQINDAQREVTKRLFSSNPTTFFNFLDRHHARLNCYKPYQTELKVGYYGKVIIYDLLFVEDGRLYTEKAHYPTSTKSWGNRISVDNQVMYTKHYMERLIERKNIETFEALKAELRTDYLNVNQSDFISKFGRLDIDTDHIIVQRDQVSFCDYQTMENDVGGILRKSLITADDFKGRQSEVVNHILDKLDVTCAVITTHEIPRSIAEANNAIEDTLKRVTTSGYWGDKFFNESQSTSADKKKFNKQAHKQLFNFLQAYDPHLVPQECMVYG